MAVIRKIETVNKKTGATSVSPIGAQASNVTYGDTDVSSELDSQKASISSEETRAKAAEKANADAVTSEAFRASEKETLMEDALDSHKSDMSNPHKVTKAQIGLGKVDNTADTAIPVKDSADKFTSGGAFTELAKKVDKVDGKGLSANDYTTAEKSKLANLAAVATTGSYSDLTGTPDAYVLPAATATMLGGIKVGAGLTVDADGTLADANAAGTTYVFTDGTNGFTATSSEGTEQKVTVTPSVADATAEAHGLLSAADKAKLDRIASGAEVNVQSDWDAVSGDALILNKPDSLSQFTNDPGYISGITTTMVANLGKLSNATSGNADTATKAAQDASGNVITAHYAPKATTLAGYGITDAYTQKESDASLALKQSVSEKGSAGGYASLDSSGRIPSSQLPSYVDDVVEEDALADFPATGESGKIYIAKDTNLTYRWSGSGYAEISASIALGETSSTAYAGDKGKTVTEGLAAHVADRTNPHAVTKAQVGLGNADNTADADKPISAAAQTALDTKVDKVDGSSLMASDEHTKLSGIAAGAEVNVNADWDAASGDAQILNKPTKLSQFTNDSGYITGITAATVNAVGTITNSTTGSSASCTGNAATATLAAKATGDAEGSDIVDSYEKKSDASGRGMAAYVADETLMMVFNLTHGTISVSGSGTDITYGGDYAGKTSDQLLSLYPFNDTYMETITPYASDKTTALTGEDKFLNMPNYWYWLDNGTDGSFTFHFASYQVTSKFSRFCPSWVTRLHLAKYLADTDGTYLRSRSGYEPVVNMNQVTALSKMPYVKKTDGTFRRCEYIDYRVWSAYFWMACAILHTRNSQSVYYGMAGWGWDSTLNNWNNIPSQLRLNGTTDGIGDGLESGEITSYVDSDSVTQSIASMKRPCRILGIENPYGFIWQNVYGFYHKADEIYAYDGIDELTSSQINPSNANFAATDTGGKCSGANGWQTTIEEHNGFTYPTSITGGAENKYSSDYYWYASNATVAFLGGYWGNGGNAGLSSLTVNNGFGYAHVNIGFRLSYVS